MSMASKDLAKPTGNKGQDDSSKYSPDTFKVLLKKLVQTPDEFGAEDVTAAFRHICAEAASEAQVRQLCHVLCLSSNKLIAST